MPYTLDELACGCCGEAKVDPEMLVRLARLDALMEGDHPRVAAAYRCKEASGAGAWYYDPGHHAGRSVTFHTADQYYRHRAIKAILECFDEVWIYPTGRVTARLTTSHAPFCITT